MSAKTEKTETAETAEAETAIEKAPKAYPEYVSDAPTKLQSRFSDWLLEKTGYSPANEESFRDGVRLGVQLRMHFQRSDENREANERERAENAVLRAARKGVNETVLAQRAAKAQERAKAAQERAEALAVKAEEQAKLLREKASGIAAATGKVKAESVSKGDVTPTPEPETDAPW
jgi:hypothetical protein